MQIRIGHSAYSGTNAMAYAKSKSEAVEILRSRGVKRDEARAAIDFARLADGYGTVYAELSPIEFQIVGDRIDWREKMEMERSILKRNANLALNLFEQYKRQHGYAPYRDTLVRDLLLVKRGISLAPPPRVITLH